MIKQWLGTKLSYNPVELAGHKVVLPHDGTMAGHKVVLPPDGTGWAQSYPTTWWNWLGTKLSYHMMELAGDEDLCSGEQAQRAHLPDYVLACRGKKKALRKKAVNLDLRIGISIVLPDQAQSHSEIVS